jgi:CheY-like chemotaxis protein
MDTNILLVEDEQALLMTLGDRLRKEGYRVDCAGDGQTGSQRAISDRFDLVILDLMLPRRSGLDVCRDIRHAGLRTPVLMLTALREPEHMVAGLKAGADDYVSKPFEMPELSARVEALLRRSPASRPTCWDPRSPSSLWPRFSGTLDIGHATSVDSGSEASAYLSSELPEEFYRHLNAKDAEWLSKAVSRMRQRLAQEQGMPRTPEKELYLDAEEGIIDFLEELLEKIRTLEPSP